MQNEKVDPNAISRRQFCQSLVGLSAILGSSIPTGAFALGAQSHFSISEIDLTGAMHRISGWQRGLFEVRNSTSIEVSDQVTQVRLDSVDLFNYPFTVLIGAEAFEPLSSTAIDNLRRYLTYGGFLLLDDASGRKQSGFQESCLRLCQRVFPNSKMVALSEDHSVYRSFFLLDKPTGRFQVSSQMLGVEVGTVTPMMYNPNDLSGALEVDSAGQYVYTPVPDGNLQRRESIKMLINLVMYALTSNYKHDQVHVAELLRREEF